MSEIVESKPRLTLEQLDKQVQALCAANGYQLIVSAIGKKSGKLSPWIDVVADTHEVALVYVEVESNGATT